MFLAMFTVYIDDSGTAPEQQVAIASGLIFPAKRMAAMEREWRSFLQKQGIEQFHTSECVARTGGLSLQVGTKEKFSRR